MKVNKFVVFLIVFLISTIISVNAQEASKSITDFSYGVDGRPVLKSVYATMSEADKTESLITATKTGIYIYNGNSYLRIETIAEPVSFGIINDIDNDLVKDIVYAANNASFYNIVAVSGKTGKEIWQKKITEEIYDYNAGFINTNKNIYKLEIINNDIAIIHDYVIEVLDSKTAKSKFKYKEKDNIWDVEAIKDINKDSVADFVIANQLGEVKAIDGKTGKLIWNSKVTKEFTVIDGKKVVGKVKRNVWQVMFMNDHLYAVCEDGSINDINYKTGKINTTLSLFEFDKNTLNNYYFQNVYGVQSLAPTGKNSKYFSSFQMFPISNNKIIVTGFVNSGSDNNGGMRDDFAVSEKGSGSSGEILETTPFMAVVDSLTMKQIYIIPLNGMELSNVEPVELLSSEELIAIPTSIKDGKLVINTYLKSSGEKKKSYEMFISNNVAAMDVSNIFVGINGDNILIEGKNKFSMLLKKDLITVVKNNDTYSTASVIQSENNEFVLSYKTSNKVNRIVKYNETNNEKIWEYLVPNDFDNDGLFSISVLEDFNLDGVKDLVGLVNKKDKNNNVVATYILVLDMKSGLPISFKSILINSYRNELNVKIDVYLIGTSVSAIRDMNNDKKAEIMLDSYIINGSSIKIIGSVSESIDTVGRSIKVGDINKDGFTDIVYVGETFSTVYLSNVQYYNITYVKTNKKYSYLKTLMNFENATLVPDINGDNIGEVVFNVKNANNKQYYKILSGSDLSSIVNIKENEGVSYEVNQYVFMGIDVDFDGYKDFYENSNWGSTLNVISGKTGNNIISLKVNENYDKGYYDEGSTEVDVIIPFTLGTSDYSFCMGNDLNKDGHNELFILTETYSPKAETNIVVYDVYNKINTPLKKILISEQRYNNKDYYVNDMAYPTGGMELGVEKLLTKISNTEENLYIIKSSQTNSMIYNMDKEKIISGFNRSIVSAKKISDNMLLAINIAKEVININYENTFEITNLKNNDKVGSPVKLKWSYEDYGGMNYVNIYDNGRFLKTSYKDSAEILLSKGEHTITFESTDRWGKILNSKLVVNVEKSSALKVLYVFIALILLVLVVFISTITKIRRKMMIRRLTK